MKDYKRMLVIENGQVGFIQDDTGNRVEFESLEDMTRCTGIDFTNKFYVGYEPEINFYADSRDPELQPGDDNSHRIPNEQYEALIAIVPTIKLRQADIAWGLKGYEKTKALAKKKQLEEEEEYENAKMSKRNAYGLHKMKVGDLENLIGVQIDSAQSLEELKEVVKELFQKLATYSVR